MYRVKTIAWTTNDGFVRERENAQGELFTFYIFYDDDTDILLTN